jgi:hypothetical protein
VIDQDIAALVLQERGVHGGDAAQLYRDGVIFGPAESGNLPIDFELPVKFPGRDDLYRS